MSDALHGRAMDVSPWKFTFNCIHCVVFFVMTWCRTSLVLGCHARRCVSSANSHMPGQLRQKRLKPRPQRSGWVTTHAPLVCTYQQMLDVSWCQWAAKRKCRVGIKWAWSLQAVWAINIQLISLICKLGDVFFLFCYLPIDVFLYSPSPSRYQEGNAEHLW